ncbi:MAG: glycine cleavage system aminomethyltransferase GcvT [Epulopiscium sp.]|nr:glycine cleavage system aminomethyltransferase GcvT [Candidatus Epulonipiscium sp.]
MSHLKKTPLYSIYEKDSKIIDFAGWALPLQFTGITQEHQTVRSKAGLFDVSHMGELEVKGKDAERFLQYLFTNDLSSLQEGGAMYGFFCNSNGGVIDDLLIYKLSKTHFLLVVNAVNTEKDQKWLQQYQKDYDVTIINSSSSIVQLALQGPKAEIILQSLTDADLSEISFFTFKRSVLLQGIPCIVSRTGYTGEDGFEIFTSTNFGTQLWKIVMEAGEPLGLQPAGLGCRDTLRFEAGLPLYGHEISEEITPIEAGLGMFVKWNKSFIGKDVLYSQKTNGIKKKLVGFELLKKGIPREGYIIKYDEKEIGVVTTGYLSPTLKKPIGMALIQTEYSTIGTEIDIMIRNRKIKGMVCKKRFYKSKKS